MGQVIHRPIAITDNPAVIVREVNSAIREISQQATENYFTGYPQVDANILSNTTLIVWVPLDQYIVESIAVVVSSGTASLTPRINATNMGVVGGVPIAVSTTVALHSIEDDNSVNPLDKVDCVVTGLSASAWLTLAMKVRRAR